MDKQESPLVAAFKNTRPNPLGQLHELLLAARDGNKDAVQKLIYLGNIISLTIIVAAKQHDSARAVLAAAPTVPVALSAFDEEIETMVQCLRQIGLGQAIPLRTTYKTGRKRFKDVSSPAFVARELFNILALQMNKTYSPSEKEAAVTQMKTEPLTAEQRLEMDVFALAPLATNPIDETGRFLKLGTPEHWADVGARLMVDGCGTIAFIPAIPDAWKKAATLSMKRGSVGKLRDEVRKNLESGFKAIAPP